MGKGDGVISLFGCDVSGDNCLAIVRGGILFGQKNYLLFCQFFGFLNVYCMTVCTTETF